MVSRPPQAGNAVVEELSESATHQANKPAMKGPQKEAYGPATPRQPKKEGQASSKAQDVAELKDYVRILPCT